MGHATVPRFGGVLRIRKNAIPIPDSGSLRSDLIAISERVASALAGPQGRVMLALIRVECEKSLITKHEYWQLGFIACCQSSTGQSLVENFPRMLTPSSFFKP